jgi:hypothetical protein
MQWNLVFIMLQLPQLFAFELNTKNTMIKDKDNAAAEDNDNDPPQLKTFKSALFY